MWPSCRTLLLNGAPSFPLNNHLENNFSCIPRLKKASEFDGSLAIIYCNYSIASLKFLAFFKFKTLFTKYLYLDPSKKI